MNEGQFDLPTEGGNAQETNEGSSEERCGDCTCEGTGTCNKESGTASVDEGRSGVSQAEVNVGNGDGNAKDISQEDRSTKEENSKTAIQDTQERESVLEEYVQAALAEQIIAFNSYSIKKAYPKAYAKLEKFMTDKAQVRVDEETTVATLLYAPRTVLFNFFDEAALFVNIYGNSNHWFFDINDSGKTAGYENRTKCEYHAFIEAFKTLETL